MLYLYMSPCIIGHISSNKTDIFFEKNIKLHINERFVNYLFLFTTQEHTVYFV